MSFAYPKLNFICPGFFPDARRCLKKALVLLFSSFIL